MKLKGLNQNAPRTGKQTQKGKRVFIEREGQVPRTADRGRADCHRGERTMRKDDKIKQEL